MLYLHEAAQTAIIIPGKQMFLNSLNIRQDILITKPKNPQKLLVKSYVLRKLQVYNPQLLKDFA